MVLQVLGRHLAGALGAREARARLALAGRRRHALRGAVPADGVQGKGVLGENDEGGVESGVCSAVGEINS